MDEERERPLLSSAPNTGCALLRRNKRRIVAIVLKVVGAILVMLLVWWLKKKTTQCLSARKRSEANFQVNLFRALMKGNHTEFQEHLQKEILDIVRKSSNSPYVVVTAMQLRLFQRLHKKGKDTLNEFRRELLRALHNSLFSWLGRREIEGLSGVRGSRGLVITTGSKMLPLTLHVIGSVRSIWNCQLPIEVFYNGEKDLPADSRRRLESLPGVRIIDLNSIFDISGLELKGWDVKPFAMLASSFESVLLLDADVVFAKSPEIYFKFKEFEQSGTLFFYDRILGPVNVDYKAWFRTILPEPFSEKLTKSLLYQAKTSYQQESGIVLIDKGKRLWGLLAACLLNRPREKQKMAQATWGEKETFWIGFEMAEEPYEFLETDAGSIGVAVYNRFVKQHVLCGHLAHFDKDGDLLWFNDGIVEDKRTKNPLPGTFIHAGNKGIWHKVCLISKELSILNQEQLRRLDKMRDLWLAQAV